MSPRYLTKSRFKTGLECPTKLFYTKKPEYANQLMDDPFLEALAEGGYQVGELAKLYHPGGFDVETLDYDDAIAETNRLLQRENVIIYEPAFRFNNLFVRVDILVKVGRKIELIEVKAKSFGPPAEEFFFYAKSRHIVKEWLPYLYDVAFQKHVVAAANPTWEMDSFLMLVDKTAICTVNGLNQKFRVRRDAKKRKGVTVSSTLSEEDLRDRILAKVNVDEMLSMIYAGTADKEPRSRSFLEEVDFLSRAYETDTKVKPAIGRVCRDCEFQCSPEDRERGLKDGFRECWEEAVNWTAADFVEPNVFEVWNAGKKLLDWLEEGKFKVRDLGEGDLRPTPDGDPGISQSERQWLQVEKILNNDHTPFFDVHGMKMEMDSWKFPLHFIDFETAQPAIPFNKGRRPYEGVNFQFSHHIVHENGRVEHAGQFLHTERGKFPSYDFIRAFKRQLDQDEGTIFRYATHENTYLNIILRQLMADEVPEPDRDGLVTFIKSITTSTKKSKNERWDGERAMVDMWALVKRYFYDPATKGSNSIKHVLPAILNSSDYLKEKYSRPIYSGLNFKDWQWVELKDGKVVDPYKRLPKLFQDISEHNLELLSQEDELGNGGAALTAYCRMQFSEMSEYEINQLGQALLKYCELDTMAMVMIYEAWREWIRAVPR